MRDWSRSARPDTTRLRTAVALAGIAAVAAILAYRADSTWDYPGDAGPPIDDLINGRWGDFLSARPAMGPVSLLLRAPFAALSHFTGDGGPEAFYNDAYRFGIFPCVVAAGILGLVLARWMAERGHHPLTRFAVVALCLVNPVALRALHFGHPEEILAATFVVGAVLAGLKGAVWWATVLVTLAVFTKQWAVLAVIPVALTVEPRALRRPVLLLVGMGLALTIPLLAADPGSLVDSTRALLDLRTQFVLPASVWWPFTEPLAGAEASKHEIPEWLGVTGHPLIIVVGLALALGYARRIRQAPLERIFPLLALILLVRCMLDPVDNSYYHVPFFMALVAWCAVSGNLIPGLLVTAVLTMLIQLGPHPVALNALYLAWSIPFAAYLAATAWGARIRIPGARDRVPGP